MFVWQAHKGKVRSLAFSPDGRLLATATGTSTRISLWNPQTGELVQRLNPSGYEVGVLSVAFAPDAPLFASGMTATVRIWSTKDWTEIAKLDPGLWEGAYYAVAFSGGSKPRFVAANPHRALVWDDAGRRKRQGERRQRASLPVGKTPYIDLTSDGSRLATSITERAVIWNLETNERVREIPQTKLSHAGPVKFSPDGTRVALGARNAVHVHRIESFDAPVVCTGHSEIVWSVCWSADGRSLFSASADGTARQWNPNTGAELRTFEWGIGEILSTAFSADGLLGAAASRTGKIVVWDVDG